MYNGDEFIAYDDEKSIKIKVLHINYSIFLDCLGFIKKLWNCFAWC